MISFKEKLGYGFGDAASSMFWKLFGMYLLFFYTDVFGMEAAAVGTMFLITRIWDSFFDPVVGVIADRTESKWGKFRPYLLFLAIPFGVIGVFTFYTPAFSTPDKVIYAYVTYSLMMIIYSGINVPYASLLGVISPDLKDRNVLSTYRMAFAYIGSFVTLLLFMPLVNYFSDYSKDIEDQRYGWLMAVGVIAVVCIILFFLCFAFTRERVKPLRKDQTPLKDDLKDLVKNKPWWILLGAGISALIFNSIRDGATIYYFKYYIEEDVFGTINLFNIPFVLSGLFGNEKDESFKSSINTIYQTFDGQELYPSVEEKAAMLLYLVTKNHSFSDGNKRIAAFLFLWFLEKNGILYKPGGTKLIENNTLVALTLMIAESRTEEKDTIVKVVVNLINQNN
jgi:GPH family glycoside/pentoside/hexuronide:cation symporter